MRRRPPDPVVETPPPTPTRRRLLALLATLPTADACASVGVKPASPPEGRDHDPVRRMFDEFRDRVANHERAFQRCSELEARLAAEVGYPRVRLPRAVGQAAHYAAEAASIIAEVSPSRQRDRLLRTLRRRQSRWDAAAESCGLTRARAREGALFQAMRGAAEAAYATPATTTNGVLLKLLVLLSLEEPGASFRDATPWRELRLILADLNSLIP